jgi:hypothetical protein
MVSFVSYNIILKQFVQSEGYVISSAVVAVDQSRLYQGNQSINLGYHMVPGTMKL